MKYFEDKEPDVRHHVERMRKMPLRIGSHLYGDFGEMPIGDAVSKRLERDKHSDKNPAFVFLSVVLAANRNYNKHVRPNIININKEYPDLKSFKDLEEVIYSMSREDFYSLWGHKNPKKYKTLIDLLNAAKVLREKYKIEDDYELMNEWAKRVELENLESDIINQIDNVSIATIQHLRMDFGINTVKPDQRVIEVLRKEFGATRVNQRSAIMMVEEISKITGIKIREIDQIFVNYGSGYYDNRKSNLGNAVRIEIAHNLAKISLTYEIIASVTGLSEERTQRIIKNL